MKTYKDLLTMIDDLPDKEDQVTKYIEYLETQEEVEYLYIGTKRGLESKIVNQIPKTS